MDGISFDDDVEVNPDVIAAADASDDELNAALEAEEPPEEEPEKKESKEPPEEVGPLKGKTKGQIKKPTGKKEEEKKDAATDQKPPADKAKAAEKKPDKVKPDVAPQKASPDNTPVKGDDAQLQKALKKLEGLDLLRKRQDSKIAILQKQLREFATAKESGLKEKWDTDPASAAQDFVEVREAKQQLSALDQEAAILQHEHTSAEFFKERFGDGSVDIDDMAKELEQQGYSAQDVANFKERPFRLYPGELQQLGEMVKLRKQFDLVAMYAKHLLEENKKFATAPNAAAQVVQKIQKNLKAPPPMNAATGRTAEAKIGSAKPLTKMSDAELEEILKS